MAAERKQGRFQLKADDSGKFRCVFATLNVVDHDGDVTRPGAFKNGAPAVIGSWGHKTSELPVGKGVLGSDDTEAFCEGEFFDTAAGRDTYETVKALGELGEWSYVYVPTKYSYGEHEGVQVRFLDEIDVWSVDPVLKGAGIGTRTTDIKSIRELPFADHLEQMREAVDELLARVKERAALRVKEGRGLSVANVAVLQEVAGSLTSVAHELGLLVAPADDSPKASDELARAQLVYQRNRARLLGLNV